MLCSASFKFLRRTKSQKKCLSNALFGWGIAFERHFFCDFFSEKHEWIALYWKIFVKGFLFRYIFFSFLFAISCFQWVAVGVFNNSWQSSPRFLLFLALRHQSALARIFQTVMSTYSFPRGFLAPNLDSHAARWEVNMIWSTASVVTFTGAVMAVDDQLGWTINLALIPTRIHHPHPHTTHTHTPTHRTAQISKKISIWTK